MNIKQRHALSLLSEDLDVFPCVVVQGARQVGKSTLAQQVASDRTSVSVTLDDPSVLNAVAADPHAFVEQHKESLLVIDEIQRAPELILPIKASIDRNRRAGRFLLTGSSDLLRHQGVPDSLAGRAVTAPLYGFSQGEIDGVQDDFVTRILRGFEASQYSTDEDRGTSIERIVRGAYPEAGRLSNRMRDRWFAGYLERVLRRDARDLRVRSDENRLATLARLIAANQSGELVKARLGRSAGVPETSVPVSLDTLEALYLISFLPSWTPNLTAREASKPKVSVNDSGLAAHLSRLNVDNLVDPLHSDRLGPLLEGFVVSEMTKQRSWSEQQYELLHWRDRDGKEVDLIIELHDGSIIALEVKTASSAHPNHFAGLRTLREKLGDRFLGGFVVHLGERGYGYGDRLWSVPLDAIWKA